MAALSPIALGYTPLLDSASAETLTQALGSFHDSLLKEFRFLGHGYVTKIGEMAMDYRLNGQLLIQSQYLRQDAIILALGIQEIHWEEYGLVVESGEIEYQQTTDGSQAMWRITFDDGVFTLVASQLFYLLLDRQQNRLLWGEAIPSEVIEPAASLGRDGQGQEWIQCRQCASTWVRRYEIEWCPQCNLAVLIQ